MSRQTYNGKSPNPGINPSAPHGFFHCASGSHTGCVPMSTSPSPLAILGDKRSGGALCKSARHDLSCCSIPFQLQFVARSPTFCNPQQSFGFLPLGLCTTVDPDVRNNLLISVDEISARRNENEFADGSVGRYRDVDVFIVPFLSFLCTTLARDSRSSRFSSPGLLACHDAVTALPSGTLERCYQNAGRRIVPYSIEAYSVRGNVSGKALSLQVHSRRHSGRNTGPFVHFYRPPTPLDATAGTDRNTIHHVGNRLCHST
jgi:hypothetical protein